MSHRFTTSQMHTQTILVFLAIELHGNSNKILKTNLFKEIDFWKSFWKSIAETGSHWACQFLCLWFWQTRASFDYYKWDRTRNLKTVVSRTAVRIGCFRLVFPWLLGLSTRGFWASISTLPFIEFNIVECSYEFQSLMMYLWNGEKRIIRG